MLEKLKSRKLWLAVAAIVTSIATALAGQLEWGQAIGAIVATVATYFAGQGFVDGMAVAAKAKIDAGKP